jgi:NADH:ubiquinone oxidoreductase subunit F (NADH-binding)/ferredoxin
VTTVSRAGAPSWPDEALARLPEVLCLGQPRLTAGLDRSARLDIAAHQAVFGPLPRLSATQLVKITAAADLRGRGGAAFPLARKISAVLESVRERRCGSAVLVNAAEGEPGSAKDRTLLLRSPYLVLGGAMVAAWALGARQIVVGAADPHVAQSVRDAADADPELRKLIRVAELPDRFVSGEGGALLNAVNGRAAVPPGRKVLPSDRGVDGLPTLLSNAETFAQLAVLSMLGPEGYATAGTSGQPGTVLLTVGGSANRPAVVEVPAGARLGDVLGLCGADSEAGVLVGGYHGGWLPPEVAENLPVSRAGLAAAGGTLGAGIVLPLGRDSCALGEVARVARYLASESSGQCGPCKLGLPGIARSLVALADGSGGPDALDTARRGAAAVRGRGACAHPDGAYRFITSALEVFAEELAQHLYRGTCGRPVKGVLPLPAEAAQTRLVLDWTRCGGHGLCAHIVPELIHLDGQGYPVMLDSPVPDWLDRSARQAVEMCPALALRLTGPPALARRKTAVLRAGSTLARAVTPAADTGALTGHGTAELPPPRSRTSDPGQPQPGRLTRPARPATARARQATASGPEGGLVVTEAWIADLTDASGLIPPVRQDPP